VGVESEPIGAGLMPDRFVVWVVLFSAVEAEVYRDSILPDGFVVLVFLFAVLANNAFLWVSRTTEEALNPMSAYPSTV